MASKILSFKTAAPAILLVALTAVWYSFHRGVGHDWGDDFGVYIQHAINMAAGRSPSSLTTGAPPPLGLPLIILGSSPFHGWDIVSMKLIGTTSIGLIGIFTYFLSRYRVSAATSFAITAAVSWNAWNFQLNQMVGADLPFTASVLACILALTVALDTRQISSERRVTALALTPIFMIAAMMIKPAGIALSVAVVVSLLAAIFCKSQSDAQSSNRPVVFALVGVVISIFLYYFFGSAASIGFIKQATPHFAAQSGIAGAPLSFFKAGVPREFENLRLLMFWFSGSNFFTFLLLSAAGVGWTRNIMILRGMAPLEWYAAAHLSMIILTPWGDGGPRYLLPELPLLYILSSSLVEGATAMLVCCVGQQARVRSWLLGKKYILAAPVMLFIAILSAQVTYSRRAISDNEIAQPEVAHFVDWIVMHTVESDIVCSFKPRAVMYLTQRRTCYNGLWQPGETAAEFMKNQKARFVVVFTRDDNNPDDISYKRIRSDASLCRVYYNSNYAVYGACMEN